jgi:hypothetical protein
MLKPIRAASLALLAIAGSAARAQTTRSPQAASIANVSWMEGTWVSADAGETVEEHWTSPAGGAMLGVSRTIANGQLRAFEFLRIVERNGRLVYIAQPNGRPPTDFTMTRIDGASVTFENPDHDYPTTIRYEKRANGTIAASIA